MKNKGFTLIELLIVVLIISILAGLLVAVINPSGIKDKARDSQRKADLRKVQTALELYFAENKQYPNKDGVVDNVLKADLETDGFINKLPIDPSDPNGYRYKDSNGRQTYIMAVMLQTELSSTDPNLCSELNNPASERPSGFTSTEWNDAKCYGVENP